MSFNFFRRKTKENKQKPNNYDPIVFINSPLNNRDDDVIGLGSIIDSISMVITKGANLIGIIANFGTGKSSLIELLSKKKNYYKRPVIINMWDCLLKQKGESIQAENISNLTKSFLYQLASGHSNKKGKSNLASFTNKRLSKKYGTISFSTSSKKIWVLFILAICSFCIYLILKNASIIWMSGFSEQWLQGVVTLKNISPVFLVMSLICLIIGLSNASIAYSYWKDQSAKGPDVNDVFDIYNEVAIQIYNKRRCKTKLIIIEDLDRIIEMDIVIGFLRELYRFNNLLSIKLKKKLVFIISIKPESELEKTGKLEDKEIFAKFFDFTVNLKPIHFEDYEKILLGFIKTLDSKSKKDLESLVRAKIIDDKLPEHFDWLMKGENLTIRNLKYRLNQAINLCITLNNKNFENAGVKFQPCAAVSYLESRYNVEYYKLIKEENKFAAIVRKAYDIRNTVKTPQEKRIDLVVLLAKATQNQDIQRKNAESASEFIKELADMFLAGDIDDDFRMYFYSYPKGSYIKTSDENDVFRLIRYPYENTSDEYLDEKVGRILEKYKQTKQTKNVIKESLDRVNTAIEEKMRTDFPAIVLQNEYIFACAWKKYKTKILDLVCIEAPWATDSIKSVAVFTKIYNYKEEDRDVFLSRYSPRFLEQLRPLEPNVIINIRQKLIEILGEDIAIFKEAFFLTNNIGLPFISKEELEIIRNIEVAIKLIDASRIDAENILYIAQIINGEKLEEENYTEAKKIYDAAIANNVLHDVLAKYLLSFLRINNTVEDSYFTIIASQVDKVKKESVVEYVNTLLIKDITRLYLEKLDELFIETGLDDEIINKLEKSNLYHTYLCTMWGDEKLDELDYTDERVKKNILNASERINMVNPEIIIALRKAILKKSLKNFKEYEELFRNEYSLISKDELDYFKDFEESLSFIDKGKVNEAQCDYLIEYINRKNRTAEECYVLFEMFDSKLAVSFSATTIKKIVDNLDYEKIDFAGMSKEQKEEASANISAALGLNDANNCIAFMKKVNSLIPILEQTVLNIIATDASFKEKYIVLINEIDKPTEKTIQWLVAKPVDFALGPNITAELLERKEYPKYLIGKTLKDGELNFDTSVLDISVYISGYKSNNKAFKVMSKNHEFLNYIVQHKLYIGMDKTRLKTLYKTNQTCDLLINMMDTFDASEKVNYFKTIPNIDLEESKDFTAFARDGENFTKFETKLIRNGVHVKLNTRYKGSFKRFMNIKYPETKEEILD